MSRLCWVRHFAGATMLTILGLAAGAARATTLETIVSRPGVTEKFLLLPASNGAPKASVILFTGGDGRIGLTPASIDKPMGNFLARTRALFAAEGLQVALLDSPSDHHELGDWRASKEHAGDISAVIRFLRAKADVPVWLVGTSMGTISTASAAARLASAPAGSGPDGIVLTSSVSIPTKNVRVTVYSGDLDLVKIPVLVVAHKDDHCRVSPASAAGSIARAFSHSPKVETLIFEGGLPPRSDPCMPFAQHGYLGIEEKVVVAIADWIKAQSKR